MNLKQAKQMINKEIDMLNNEILEDMRNGEQCEDSMAIYKSGYLNAMRKCNSFLRKVDESKSSVEPLYYMTLPMTEKEIKEKDESLWEFAVPVDEYKI